MNLFDILTNIIETLGYGGVFTATGLEYACFPISSELLLPFIGYTVSKGNMNLPITILVSTAAGVFGSFCCYTTGRIGGSFLEQTICKRFKTIHIGMEKAKDIFRHYGRQSVFFARVFPLARTYISFPAGMASMPTGEFLLYTALGAFLWNTLLISCGYFFGSHLNTIKPLLASNKMIPVYGLFGVLILFILFKLLHHKKS